MWDFKSQEKIRQTGDKLAPLTDNGMHLTEDGYAIATKVFEFALGIQPHPGAEDVKGEHPQGRDREERAVLQRRGACRTRRTQPGFRKHEQGKNAKEIAEFDPFIAKAEAEIAKIRKELKK